MTLIARCCSICARILHATEDVCPEHAAAPVVRYGIARTPPALERKRAAAGQEGGRR